MHHIFNTNFEWELETDPKVDLEHAFSKIQKKFLPLGKLFAKEGDTVFPERPIPGQKINAWAPSKLIERYAKKYDLQYQIPDWTCVKKIQSKEFAHELSPLPGSAIIRNEEELQMWLKETPPPYVFKSFYGFSGTGHKFRPENLKFPVLAEPWVTRSIDFSTQWEMQDGKIQYLGATVLISDEMGKYRATKVALDEKALFGENYHFLKEHISKVEKLSLSPFFGNIGFDAFVYNNTLQPICEINARKTFGFLALYLMKQNPTKSFLQLNFDINKGLVLN